MPNRVILLINTVKEMWEVFTWSQYERANQAEWYMVMVGYPYENDFNNMVCYSTIPKSPVTLEETKDDHTIFVPNFPSLKEKWGGGNQSL